MPGQQEGPSGQKGRRRREERGKDGVWGDGGLWAQHWACSGGAACLLLAGTLPLVQMRASDTAKLFLPLLLVIQTDWVFRWLPHTVHLRSDARGYSIRDLNNAVCKFITLSVPEHVS